MWRVCALLADIRTYCPLSVCSSEELVKILVFLTQFNTTNQISHEALSVYLQLARHNKVLQNLLKPPKQSKEGDEGISSMVNPHLIHWSINSSIVCNDSDAVIYSVLPLLQGCCHSTPVIWQQQCRDVAAVLHRCGRMTQYVFLQLNLNNRPLSQMLKSSAPAAVVEQDPLEFYEQHTAQIEVQLLILICTHMFSNLRWGSTDYKITWPILSLILTFPPSLESFN